MSILTDYARNLLTGSLCGHHPAQPAAVFAALGTGGSASTGVTGEPVGFGYARQAVSFNGNGAGQQQNASAVAFNFTSPAGTLTHIGLFDAVSGGNALTWSALSQPVAVNAAGTVTVPAAGLVISGS